MVNAVDGAKANGLKFWKSTVHFPLHRPQQKLINDPAHRRTSPCNTSTSYWWRKCSCSCARSLGLHQSVLSSIHLSVWLLSYEFMYLSIHLRALHTNKLQAKMNRLPKLQRQLSKWTLKRKQLQRDSLVLHKIKYSTFWLRSVLIAYCFTGHAAARCNAPKLPLAIWTKLLISASAKKSKNRICKYYVVYILIKQYI